MSTLQRRVGDYAILSEPGGQGATATILVGQHVRTGRRAALKPIQRVGDDLRELRHVSTLGHPNVVTLFEDFEHDGVPYIAMEFMERGSLRPLIGTLTPAQIFGAIEAILSGLQHAHDHGLVHRDAKPENVLVAADGTVKLADFGAAKSFAQVTLQATQAGLTVGTPAYMSPEQAIGDPTGPATDLYSTGLIAYELWLHTLPYPPTRNPIEQLVQHVREPILAPRSVDPALDAGIAAWLERMLAKDAADRPPSAREAWEQLEVIAAALLGPLWRRDAPIASAAAEPPVAPAPAAAAVVEPEAPESNTGGAAYITYHARRRAPVPRMVETSEAAEPPPPPPIVVKPSEAETVPPRAVW